MQNVVITLNGVPRPDIKPDVVRRDFRNKISALGQIRAGVFEPNIYTDPRAEYMPGYPSADNYRLMEIPRYADYMMLMQVESGEQYYRKDEQHLSVGFHVSHLLCSLFLQAVSCSLL